MRFCGRLRSRFSKACKLVVLRNKLLRTSSLMLSINSPNMAEGLVLVFDEGILLCEGAQVNSFAQAIHGIKMLLPKPVNRIQDDEALEAAQGFGMFHRRLPIVSILDHLKEPIAVLFDGPRFADPLSWL